MWQRGAIFLRSVGGIILALIPSLAAREVVVSALGTVYAFSQVGDNVGTTLAPLLAAGWTLATGLSLLV